MPSPVHLVVLQHGLWGAAGDMAALASMLRLHSSPRVMVLNAGINEARRTYDGIDIAGERLADLVLSFCARLAAGELRQVTHISFMGYSLGGLICRFAIGKLASTGFFGTGLAGAADDDGAAGKGVTPVNFVSLASPHLGCWASGSFYRHALNIVLPWTLSRTGCQLVYSDEFVDGLPLLYVMAHPDYVFHAGLTLFTKRIAFANLRHDATVPHFTAAIEHCSDSDLGHGMTHLPSSSTPISARYPCIVHVAGTALTGHQEPQKAMVHQGQQHTPQQLGLQCNLPHPGVELQHVGHAQIQQQATHVPCSDQPLSSTCPDVPIRASHSPAQGSTPAWLSSTSSALRRIMAQSSSSLLLPRSSSHNAGVRGSQGHRLSSQAVISAACPSHYSTTPTSSSSRNPSSSSTSNPSSHLSMCPASAPPVPPSTQPQQASFLHALSRHTKPQTNTSLVSRATRHEGKQGGGPARAGRLRAEVFLVLLPVFMLLWGCMMLWLCMISCHHYALLMGSTALKSSRDRGWGVRRQPHRFSSNTLGVQEGAQGLPAAQKQGQQQLQGQQCQAAGDGCDQGVRGGGVLHIRASAGGQTAGMHVQQQQQQRQLQPPLTPPHTTACSHACGQPPNLLIQSSEAQESTFTSSSPEAASATSTSTTTSTASSGPREAVLQRGMCDYLNTLAWQKVDVDCHNYHAHAAIVVRSCARFGASHGHILEYCIKQMKGLGLSLSSALLGSLAARDPQQFCAKMHWCQ